MAKNPQDGGELGFRKTYKMTGTPGFAGGPDQKVENGPSGSKRAPTNAAKGKPARSSKVGPDKNLKDIGGGNFY
jgi:hypothetical protein